MTGLEQDVRGLLAELKDPDEAEAVQLLLELASELEWQPAPDDGYRPFVYPH